MFEWLRKLIWGEEPQPHRAANQSIYSQLEEEAQAYANKLLNPPPRFKREMVTFHRDIEVGSCDLEVTLKDGTVEIIELQGFASISPLCTRQHWTHLDFDKYGLPPEDREPTLGDFDVDHAVTVAQKIIMGAEPLKLKSGFYPRDMVAKYQIINRQKFQKRVSYSLWKNIPVIPEAEQEFLDNLKGI